MARLSLIAGILALVFSTASYAQSDECSMALQNYQNQSYSELVSLEKTKKTKIENTLYRKIKKEAELIKKYKVDSVSFIKSVDEFTKDKEYQTTKSKTSPFVSKVSCKDSKPKDGFVYESDNIVFIRKNCKAAICIDPQIYIVQYETEWSKYPLSYDFFRYYSGINRVVIKGLGDVEHNKINYDFALGSFQESLGLKKLHSAHHGVSIKKEYLTKLYQNQDDIELRIYSTGGSNFDVSVPFAHVKAFVEGMNSEGTW